MEWQQLLTCKRLGKALLEDRQFERTPFLKDYDRLVYSSAFRCLKDKTQVFPLAKNDDIRTRLIHSLEVSCVGRSLGRIVGDQIIKRHHLDTFNAADFGDILSAACIAHDIGNPPFGHSGEDAIRASFRAWYSRLNASEQQALTESEKTDFDGFEGNAQGFRILTRLEMPHRQGGMQLTCATLAAFTKYPRESLIAETILQGYSGRSTSKYGFFQSEKAFFTEVAETVGLIRRHPQVAWWARHPLAFLVEAADDICYSIIDLEDGFRMGYVPFEEVRSLLYPIANTHLNECSDSRKEIVKRLRAKAINQLVWEVAQIFLDYEVDILAGTFDRELLFFSTHADTLQAIEQITRSQVFQHPNVVSVKIAGYEVLGGLLAEWVNASFHPSKKGELLLYMLPPEYRPQPEDDSYQKILKITDYICGMTDSSATTLFQHLRGISL
jgi:dGTPase